MPPYDSTDAETSVVCPQEDADDVVVLRDLHKTYKLAWCGGEVDAVCGLTAGAIACFGWESTYTVSKCISIKLSRQLSYWIRIGSSFGASVCIDVQWIIVGTRLIYCLWT